MNDMKQVPVFADLVCAKYLGYYHIIFRYSISFIPEGCLCWKHILFGQLGLFCFDGNRGIYSQRSWEVWRATSWIFMHGSSKGDELQFLHELWNNAFIFMLLGFLNLSQGSI